MRTNKRKLRRMMDIINFLCWVETTIEGARWEEYPRHLYVNDSYIGGILEEYPEYFLIDKYSGGDMKKLRELRKAYKAAGSPDGYCHESEVFYL